ncbi:unnamed protein product, partial [Staurois parvus]
MTSALSCDQLCPITADRTDHQYPDDKCSPSVPLSVSMPPASAHQCHINATYQYLPVHINATYQCPSELPFSATYQCQSGPPISASQCRISVRISAPI